MPTSTTQGQEPVVTMPGYVPPPTIDPTSNVRALVDEVVIRMDSLREADRRREDELREAERRYAEAQLAAIREINQLRADHNRELRVAESERINAIRAVDVNAVAIATERANAQAQVLANQVQSSAETLRSLVATTAANQKQQYDATTAQLSDRLTTLEQQQYKGQGSAGQISPQVQEQLDRMMASIATLKESRDRGEGKSGISQTMLIAIAVAITGIFTFILQRLLLSGGL